MKAILKFVEQDKLDEPLPGSSTRVALEQDQTGQSAAGPIGNPPTGSGSGIAAGVSANVLPPVAPVTKPVLEAGPPPRKKGIMVWLALLMCIAFALPAMVLEIGRPDVTNAMEARTITMAMHTRERWNKFGSLWVPLAVDPLVPLYNGNKLWRQPPGTAWTQMIMLGVTQNINANRDPKSIVRWLRIDSVLMATLTLCAVFWAGYCLSGLTAATLATLLCAACPLFVYSARLATTPIHYTAWLTLGIAAALWAIRPLKPAPTLFRQATGWALCGIAWAMAIFCAGPEALATLGLPVLMTMILCPNRVGHLLGLVAALILGVLLVLPWAFYVQNVDPQAWSAFLGQMLQPDPTSTHPQFHWLTGVGMRSLWLLAVILPWTLWAIVAIGQPLSTSSAGTRVRLFLGGVWFLSVSLVLVLLPSTEPIYELLPVVPAVAVLVGQLFAQFSDLAAMGHYTKSWRFLRWPHLGIMMCVSVGLPTMMLTHSLPSPSDLLEPSWLSNLDLLLYPGLMIALLGIWLLSVRWSLKHFPALSMASWAVWLMALMTVIIVPWARWPAQLNPIRKEMAAVMQQVGDVPFYWLSTSEANADPSPFVLLYSRRPILELTPEQVPQACTEKPKFFLLAPEAAQKPEAEMKLMLHLKEANLNLWSRDAKPLPIR